MKVALMRRTQFFFLTFGLIGRRSNSHVNWNILPGYYRTYRIDNYLYKFVFLLLLPVVTLRKRLWGENWNVFFVTFRLSKTNSRVYWSEIKLSRLLRVVTFVTRFPGNLFVMPSFLHHSAKYRWPSSRIGTAGEKWLVSNGVDSVQ